MSLFCAQQSTVHAEEVLGGDHVFSQDMRGLVLPTSHCMIVAEGKTIRQIALNVHEEDPPRRMPLTWSIWSRGKWVDTAMEAKADAGRVMWLGLALSYFAMHSVRVVGLREPGSTSRVFPDA